MIRLASIVTAVFVLTGCASTVTLRASSSDFLKPAATQVILQRTPEQVQQLVEQLFAQRGYGQTGPAKELGPLARVIYFKGPRSVPPGTTVTDLGSWFAVRLSGVKAENGAVTTTVTMLGKPALGGFEFCSDGDDLLKDLAYTCRDTKVPTGWSGMALVSGRDETEVVTWVLSALYEQMH